MSLFGGLRRVTLERVVIISLALFLGLAAFQIFTFVTEAPPFDPWGDFPVQTVLPEGSIDASTLNLRENPFITAETPIFDLSETEFLTIVGTKCVKDTVTEPIVAGGEVSWSVVQPPSFEFTEAYFTGNPNKALPVGCTQEVFENYIPVEIREHSNALFAEGYDSVVVNVHGYSAPMKGSEEIGVRKDWVSRNFVFVP